MIVDFVRAERHRHDGAASSTEQLFRRLNEIIDPRKVKQDIKLSREEFRSLELEHLLFVIDKYVQWNIRNDRDLENPIAVLVVKPKNTRYPAPVLIDLYRSDKYTDTKTPAFSVHIYLVSNHRGSSFTSLQVSGERSTYKDIGLLLAKFVIPEPGEEPWIVYVNDSPHMAVRIQRIVENGRNIDETPNELLSHLFGFVTYTRGYIPILIGVSKDNYSIYDAYVFERMFCKPEPSRVIEPPSTKMIIRTPLNCDPDQAMANVIKYKVPLYTNVSSLYNYNLVQALARLNM